MSQSAPVIDVPHFHEGGTARSDQSIVFALAALAILTIGLFGRTITFKFIDYDDTSYVTENRHVQSGVNPASLAWAMTTHHAGYWHPLTWVSHLIDVELFGLNPGGHHATNVLIHAINACLLMSLLLRMTGAFWRSAFVAAVFAIHPLHVESVAWIAERKDVLSTMLMLLAMLAYVRYVERTTWRRYAVVLLLFGLGLCGKPMIVTLPALLLLMDYWPLRRTRWLAGEDASRRSRSAGMLIFEKLPMLAMSLALAGVAIHGQKEVGTLGTLDKVPIAMRLSNAVVSYAIYMGKTIWPTNLAFFYPYPIHIPVWKIALAGGVLIVTTAAALWHARRRPWLAVGWFWYLGLLVPAIGIVQVGSQARADRYTYVSMVGLLMMFAWSFPDARTRIHRNGVIVAAAAVLIGLGATTWMQLSHWRDSRSLFTHAIAVTEDNWVARNNLGKWHLDREEYAIAEMHLREAVRINDTHATSVMNLGVLLARQKRLDEGMPLLQAAIRMDPSDARAHLNFGTAMADVGDEETALRHYREAARLDPDSAAAHFNIGNTLLRRGMLDEARDSLLKAVSLDSRLAPAQHALGLAFRELGEAERAVTPLHRAAALDPTNADYQNDLAMVLNALRRHAEAAVCFAHAVRLRPESPELHNNLGSALAADGLMALAAEQFTEAIRLKPDYVDAHFNLGLTMERLGRAREAGESYRRVLELRPDHARALQRLGMQEP